MNAPDSAADPVGPLAPRALPWWLEPALVAVLAGAVFSTALTAPFTQWDDDYYVTRQPHLHAPGLDGFVRQWSFDAALQDHLVEFFPLRDSVYWVLWHGFGPTPLPFHLANILLHMLAAVLVRRLALALGLSRWAALASGLLFATHPVHVESVAWVSALKDPLFLCLMLGAVLNYLRFRETLRLWNYGLALLLLAGALASKSLALPTALLFVAAERLVGRPSPWGLIAKRAVGPVAVTAVSLWHILAIGRAAEVVSLPHGGSWPNHWFLMAWAMVRYLGQAFVPATFRVHYCFPPPSGLTDPRSLAIALAVVAVAAFFAWAWRNSRTVLFLGVWFFACLLPVSNLVPFPALMADRYLYSGTVAAVMLVAVTLERFRGRGALLAAAVLVFGATTLSRAALWNDERALFEEVAADEACWQEQSALAANALMQWAWLQPTPETMAAALEKVLTHPAAAGVREARSCQMFRRTSFRLPQRDPILELQAAALGANMCRSIPTAWERLTQAAWTIRPERALEAARHAWDLDHSALHRWQLGLARLNARDPGGTADLEAAVRQSPPRLCPLYLGWADTAAEPQLAATAGARAACPRVSSDPR